MATTYSWKVQRMDYIISHESGNSNVVNVVSCDYIGVSDSGTVKGIEKVFNMDIENLTTFISWEDLTEETVLGWVVPTLSEMEIGELQGTVQGAINDVETPYESSGLPWEYEMTSWDMEKF